MQLSLHVSFLLYSSNFLVVTKCYWPLLNQCFVFWLVYFNWSMLPSTTTYLELCCAWQFSPNVFYPFLINLVCFGWFISIDQYFSFNFQHAHNTYKPIRLLDYPRRHHIYNVIFIVCTDLLPMPLPKSPTFY